MSTQLILPLHPLHSNNFENFYISRDNILLLNCLHSFSLKKGEPYIYIWGNSGVGCTHLLQACCHAAQQQGYSVAYLPLNTILQMNNTDILYGLENMDILCIDALESISNSSHWQESLFHLYNRLQEQGRYLLIAAKNIPKQLDLSLPDLVSRLSSGILFQVRELNDEEKLAALRQRAHLRGLEFSDEVGRFLLLRLPRETPALFLALECLDRATSRLKRKLTVPLVKTILGL